MACKDFINDINIKIQETYYNDNEIFKENKILLSIMVRKIIKLLINLVEANHNPGLLTFLSKHLSAGYLLELLTNEFEYFINETYYGEYTSEYLIGVKPKKYYSIAQVVEACHIRGICI